MKFSLLLFSLICLAHSQFGESVFYDIRMDGYRASRFAVSPNETIIRASFENQMLDLYDVKDGHLIKQIKSPHNNSIFSMKWIDKILLGRITVDEGGVAAFWDSDFNLITTKRFCDESDKLRGFDVVTDAQ